VLLLVVQNPVIPAIRQELVQEHELLNPP